MTTYVANTVRRYVAQLTELGHGAPVLEKFDRLAIAAISKHCDLPATELLRLFDYIADKGPADIALRCGGARRLAELGVVGHAIASCPTLRAALEIAIAHGAAGDKYRQVHYQMRGEDWMVDIRAAPELRAGVRRLICEEWIATFFAHLAEVTQITRPQVRIELNYAPAPGVDYARWLPAMPVFGQRRCRLIMPIKLLEQPLLSYDHDMLQLIVSHFAERPVARSDFAERVRRYLVLNEGPPKLPAAAAHIGISARTLIRRLEEEGTTYSAVLEEHRRGYALALARDGKLGLKQISAALGYSSEQSLQRAFVQWTGKSLHRWRRDAGVEGRGSGRRKSASEPRI